MFAENGHTSEYKSVPLGKEAVAALRTGRNVLAVHCRQTTGGQFLDLGLLTEKSPVLNLGGHDLLLDGPVENR